MRTPVLLRAAHQTSYTNPHQKRRQSAAQTPFDWPVKYAIRLFVLVACLPSAWFASFFTFGAPSTRRPSSGSMVTRPGKYGDLDEDFAVEQPVPVASSKEKKAKPDPGTTTMTRMLDEDDEDAISRMSLTAEDPNPKISDLKKPMKKEKEKEKKSKATECDEDGGQSPRVTASHVSNDDAHMDQRKERRAVEASVGSSTTLKASSDHSEYTFQTSDPGAKIGDNSYSSFDARKEISEIDMVATGTTSKLEMDSSANDSTGHFHASVHTTGGTSKPRNKRKKQLRASDSSSRSTLVANIDDESTVGFVLHDDEVPGAHSVPGSRSGHRDGSNGAAREGPHSNSVMHEEHEEEEPDFTRGSESVVVATDVADSGGAVVTAWLVEPEGGEEDKTGSAKKGLIAWIRGHRILTALMIVMSVVALVVPLAVLLPSDVDSTSNGDADADQDGDVDQNDDVSRRFTEVLQIIKAVMPGEEILSIANLTKHQYDAIAWLADNDTLAMDFKNEDPTLVVQRYSLAAAYYATTGWPSMECLPFMSELDVCDWKVLTGSDCYASVDGAFSGGMYTDEGNFVSSFMGDFELGVSCDGNGYATSLMLRK
jgi:hypothetical protein